MLGIKAHQILETDFGFASQGMEQNGVSWFCTGVQYGNSPVLGAGSNSVQILVYLKHKSPSLCTSLFFQMSSDDSSHSNRFIKSSLIK